jgi:hypothetical protein
VRDSLRQLERYWFGYGSPVSLGIMRILIGIATFLNLLITFAEFDDWYSERGYVPQAAALKYTPLYLEKTYTFFGTHTLPFSLPRFNLLAGVTDTRITFAFWVVTLLACLLMTVGLWTRISTIILAIGIVTIHHRNAMILHGGDSLQRIAVLYLALAPAGAACSFDRLIGLWKGRIQPGPVRVSLWPQRLITYNLALVYFTTVWHKWGGSQWRSGIATWFPARLNEFKRFPVPGFVNDFPFVYLTTYGTLATELAMATLVFYKPFRKWVLMAGLMMHGFIEYSMNIPLFSFTICSLYVTFFEGEEVTAWAYGIGERLRRFRIYVRFPQGMRLRTGPAAMLAAADPLGLVFYEPGTAATWEAKDERAKPKNPYLASRIRSLGAWPTAIVPGLWKRIVKKSVQPAPEESQPETPPSPKIKARR